ncbi:MAG: CbtB-domain containing protein [Proteobacteria bacterium]|nr:CbtB-domain containing protein [Pseudomonadota bacterium]
MNDQIAAAAPSVQIRTRAVTAALVAMVFGAFVVGAVGFAGAMEIHNTAHDSRHSFAFPCH